MPPRTRKGSAGRGGRPAGAPGQPPLTPGDIQRAAALKRYREQNDLSQAEMGSMLGVSQATISQYEQAKTRVPDDVFEHLLAEARQRMEEETAQTPEEAQLRAAVQAAAPNEDIPPEILQALKAVAEAGEGTDPAAIEATLTSARKSLTDKRTATLPAAQKAAAADVRMAYTLLAKILGRFDPDLGGLIDSQSGELALSVVEAAEVSPLLARLVDLLKVGPLSNCIVLHVMLLVQYDNIRQMRNAERRQQAREQAARQPVEPTPIHPSAAEQIDPTLGAFAAA